MIQNRDYQQDCIDIVWRELFRSNDSLVVLPTASGKTIIFSLFLKKAIETMERNDRSLKSMVLVNKVKLVTQTEDKLQRVIEQQKIGLFCGSLNKRNESNVTVASIQTVYKMDFDLNILIIDEAHNADQSKTYERFINRCKEINPKIKIIRFTATPFTASGGYIFGENKPNERIVFQRTMMEQIDSGWIVEPIFPSTKESFDTSKLKMRGGDFVEKDLIELTKDQEKIRAQVLDALPRLKERKKIVWAATCIKHAETLQKIINEFEPCSIIHSKLKKHEQQRNLQDFEEKEVRHISSVSMVSEGYDHEPVDAIVIMRPTRSPVLYVQLVGRGLRLFPGKENCLILDYGEVVENLGHPSKPVVKTGRKKKDQEKKAIICPSCEHFAFLPVDKCRNCGHEFFKESRKIDRLKNLTTQTGAHKFNKKKMRETTPEILDWKIEDYTSKAGNDCLKVTYFAFLNTYVEYIKKGTWFHKNFEKEQRIYKRCPKKIHVELNGKFINVKKRFY